MITTQQIPATLAGWSKNRGKILFAMQSSGKYRPFLGEGLLETKRETSIIKDLRAAQAPRKPSPAV